MLQVFGINLGHTLERAQGLMEKFGDDFVSVEHLFLALFDDPRVGHPVLVEAGMDKAKVEEAIKVCCCDQGPAFEGRSASRRLRGRVLAKARPCALRTAKWLRI